MIDGFGGGGGGKKARISGADPVFLGEGEGGVSRKKGHFRYEP